MAIIFQDTWPVHPGRLVRNLLRDQHITQRGAAEVMAMPLNRLTDIMGGRRRITADSAIMLGALFDMPPQYFLNRQRDYDLAEARAAHERRRLSARDDEEHEGAHHERKQNSR